ncbi:hypothetical protein [Candidatus Thiodubiliella endoseptemdiera]
MAGIKVKIGGKSPRNANNRSCFWVFEESENNFEKYFLKNYKSWD